MQVNQIYTILNDIMLEVTGQPTEGEDPAVIVNEDLSNVVDIGTSIFSNNWRDNYVKSMINRIGREVFVDRSYSGFAPSILKDAWEYGSIMSKTRSYTTHGLRNNMEISLIYKLNAYKKDMQKKRTKTKNSKHR